MRKGSFCYRYQEKGKSPRRSRLHRNFHKVGKTASFQDQLVVLYPSAYGYTF